MLEGEAGMRGAEGTCGEGDLCTILLTANRYFFDPPTLEPTSRVDPNPERWSGAMAFATGGDRWRDG
jgi:hypothetical protein